MTRTAISPRLAIKTFLSTARQSGSMRVAERVRATLAATTRFDDVRHFDEIDSTNTWVREQADAGAPEGLVAVAEHQSAGRGRLGRSWEAPAGTGLMVSVLVRPAGLAPDRLHLVTAAVGLSAQRACRAVAGFTPELKWPNDLLVGDAKLAGILADSGGGAVVVGLGLNLRWAPPGALAAEDVAGRPVGRDELLASVLTYLDAALGRWQQVGEHYALACATVGRRVRVELHGGSIEGRAEALDAAGRLVVRPDGGEPVALSAGDVVHLRRGDPGC